MKGQTAPVQPDRVRAWLLLRAEQPHEAAIAISALFNQGGNDWVVVRADVVEGSHNLIVPVDAADDQAFAGAVSLIGRTAGVTPEVLRVVRHYPSPAHNAHSFVTEEELKGKYAPEFDPPGRHMPKSPGANPWG